MCISDCGAGCILVSINDAGLTRLKIYIRYSTPQHRLLINRVPLAVRGIFSIRNIGSILAKSCSTGLIRGGDDGIKGLRRPAQRSVL